MEVTPVQIVNQPHPIIPSVGREITAQNHRSGETAREALLRAGLDPHLEIVILVNDRTLTVEEWDTVCPAPGDMVHAVAAVSGGGDGGSNPLKIVLSIVVMVAAWYAAPYLAAAYEGVAVGSASAMSVGVSGALISIAGNMVIGAIFKPSTGALASSNGVGSAASPTYSLSGGSNSLRPYEPMPIIMGEHRIFPDYGAKPYTEFNGADQYLYQIFNFGLSSCQISGIHIGDSPLANYSGVSLYWSDASGAMPNFPGNVDSESGAALTRETGWITRTSAADSVRLAVDFEGSIYYSGDSGLVPCQVRVEAQYAPAGSGAWQPLTSGTAVSYTTGFWSLQTTEQAWVNGAQTGTNSGDSVYNAGSDDSSPTSYHSDGGES